MIGCSLSAEQLVSLPPWNSKQQALIVEGNVPAHVTGGITAMGEFAKVLNSPFKS